MEQKKYLADRLYITYNLNGDLIICEHNSKNYIYDVVGKMDYKYVGDKLKKKFANSDDKTLTYSLTKLASYCYDVGVSVELFDDAFTQTKIERLYKFLITKSKQKNNENGLEK